VVALRVLAFLGGGALVLVTVSSALKTVVVPRAESAVLSRAVFLASRKIFDLRLRRVDDWEQVDRIMSRYAPVSLILLPAAWMTLAVAGFTPMYWALGSGFPRESFTRAGSSLLTLGFAFAKDLPETALSFVAATIGLGLVALLISYLPSIYASFSRREVLVGQLTTRAGSPPEPAELLVRALRIDWIGHLDELWAEWDRWFVEVEESHTSNASLPFFRSQHPERSWLTAAGCVLDTAALRASALDLERSFEAELCIRTGYLALRRLADLFDIEYDPNPQPDDPISIAREEFDEVWDQLDAAGAPLVDDRDQAWRDFAGWRVNYDRPLLMLAALVNPPYAKWSSDRGIGRYRPPVRPATMRRRRA
jgi:ABC-type multidrug transport system fused ATPase/permease subunit